MKKQTLKGISLLVIAVLLISQVGATQPLTAEEMAPAEETTELGVPYSEIPLELTPQMLDERNHVRRVRDEEVQENMAVFENADGTRTAYLFSEDIWYEDEAGRSGGKRDCIQDGVGVRGIAAACDTVRRHAYRV